MNLIGTSLAGIYVVVATLSAYAMPGQAGDSPGDAGEDTECASGEKKFAVSQPGTTVKVTFPGTNSPAKASSNSDDCIFDAKCSKSVVLSNVCPGATVNIALQGAEALSDEQENGDTKTKTTVTLWFPQLPASEQVVCVKSPAKPKTNNECKAIITVAAAPPQGPQACAVGGTSIMLEINNAGGSAQFKCGNERTLAPPERTQAYADDCSKVETLKDMTRSDASPEAGYVTVKVDKLKKKTLCYLCQPNKSGRQQKREQDDTCKVYVHVSGSTKFPSTVPYTLALPCLAAMLRFA